MPATHFSLRPRPGNALAPSQPAHQSAPRPRAIPALALATSLLALFPALSHAEFVYDGPRAVPPPSGTPPSTSGGPTIITESLPAAPRSLLPPPPAGKPAHPQPSVQGSGRDMPIAAALRVLIPPTYTVAPLSSSVASKTLTFQGKGRTWDVVLLPALTDAGLTATVTNRTITITPRSTTSLSEPAAQAPGGAAASSSTSAPPKRHLSDDKDLAAELAAPQSSTWTVTKGLSLKAVLEDWTKQAGYDLLWHACKDGYRPGEQCQEINWKVEAGGTLHGEFDPPLPARSVVEDLFAGFDDAATHPRGSFSSSNRVLEVTAE